MLGGLNLAREHGIDDGEPTWRMQVSLLEYLATRWQEPDDGLWEIRGDRQHFVHSKVLAWVAFDRMARTARGGDYDGPHERWQATADQIHAEVCERGFDPVRNTFTQYYGSSELDAATLLMSKVGFLPGDDPRMVGTIAQARADLGVEGFIRRYSTEAKSDGFTGSEGTFLACSFWLVEAMAAAGQIVEARELFENLLATANDLGLMAEEYDPYAGQQLGNFPQAYSHVGLINAALKLQNPHA